MQALKDVDADKKDAAASGTQYAALCYRTSAKGKAEVLLITSRDTGRWVIPKGWPIDGKSAAESAAREAFEEAGVEGRVEPQCIGLYSYGKVLAPEQVRPCIVAVYPLRVDALRRRFPERGQRRLKWFSPRKAATKVAEPELAALLEGFEPGPRPAPDGKPAGEARPAPPGQE